MDVKTYASIFTSTIGTCLWAYVVMTTRVWWIDPVYEFGLFQVISLWFWVGLLFNLVGILLSIKYGNDHLFLLQIMILNLMIWGTPIIVEPNTRHIDTWTHIGSTKIMMDSGRWMMSEWRIERHPQEKLQYPGSFIFNAVFLIVSKLPESAYFRFFPLWFSTFFLISLYNLVRNIIKEKVNQKFGMIAFLFLNIWLMFHGSPLAFGLMLFPLIFYALIRRTVTWRVVATILYMSLVISHAITSLVLLIILAGANAILLVYGKRYEMIPLFFGVLWIAWFVWVSTLYFGMVVEAIYHGILSMSLLMRTRESVAIRAVQYGWPFIIRLVTIAVTSAVASIYIIHRRRDLSWFAFNAGWIGASYLFMFLNYIAYGEWSFDNRSLMFAYLLIPLLIVQFVWSCKALKKYRNFVLLATILLSLIHTSTIYYLENTYIISDSNIANATFLVKHLPSQPSARVLGTRLSVWYSYNISAQFEWIGFTRIEELPPNSIIVFDVYTMSITGSQHSRDAMLRLYGTVIEETNSNRIYDNGNFEAYQITPG